MKIVPSRIVPTHGDYDARRWRSAAACSEVPSDLFFPVGTANPGAMADTAAAKAICAECAVRPECLAFALNAREDDGIWGGLDPAERRRLRRQDR